MTEVDWISLHGEFGREGEGVSTETVVCAGQWSGHSILSSSANHDEEGMFAGLWKKNKAAVTCSWSVPQIRPLPNQTPNSTGWHIYFNPNTVHNNVLNCVLKHVTQQSGVCVTQTANPDAGSQLLSEEF